MSFRTPLGGLLLCEPIGRGGMGEVWRAEDPGRGMDVAVKVLTPQAARDPIFLRAFRQEVRSAARLHHPGIVQVHDHGSLPGGIGGLSAGCPYVVMELIRAGSLLRYRGKLSWPALRDCLLALLSALAHAHARGVIHRDLKPSNILLASKSPRDLRLADFGLAHALDRQLPDATDELSMGTPSYMPPEQIEGLWRDFGPWTDLYALGCTAWALAAGTPPFGKLPRGRLFLAQLMDEPPAFVPAAPMPSGFEGWLRKLLRKRPEHRYRSAPQAAVGLLAVVDDRPAIGSPRRARTPAFLRPGPTSPARPSDRDLAPPGVGLFGLRPLPLVDRERPRRVLWETLQQVLSTRHTRVVLLRGSSGVGKTRLAEWLGQVAEEAGVASVVEALHGPMSGPHDGLAPMLARHLKCIGLEGPALRDRLRAQFAARSAADVADVEGLAQLFGAAPVQEDEPLEGEPTLKLKGGAERFALVRRILGRLASARPLIVKLDDVQEGMDSLEFVRWLLDGAGGPPLPLCIVLTVCDESLAGRLEEASVLADLAGRSIVTELEIGPLPKRHRARLVRGLLGLEPALAGEVERRTAGNPLFAVQWVGDWLARGLLTAGPDGLRLKPGVSSEPPDDLQDQWTTRLKWLLAAFPAAEAQGLEVAAVLGQEVGQDDWEDACAQAGVTASADLVETLLDARLARSLPGGWSFTHAMLRECLVLRSDEGGRLQAAHRACARMLRKRAGRDVNERLGRHLVGAGDWAEALPALLAGIRRRVDTGDYGLARSLLAVRDRALDALGLPASEVRVGESAVMRVQLLRLSGRLEEAGARGDEVLADAERGGASWSHVRALASRECGRAARWRGDRDAALTWFLAAEAAAAQAGDEWLMGMALHDQANLLLTLGRLTEAHRALQAAIALQQGTGDTEGMGASLLGMAELARRRGDLDRAVLDLKEAKALFEAEGVRWGRAMAANILAEVQRAQGDLSAAEAGYREALDMFVAIGATHSIFPEINLSVVLIERGRYAEARAGIEATLDSLERRHMTDLAGELNCCLLPCVAAAGDWDAWDRHAEAGMALLRKTGSVDPDTAMLAGLAGRLAATAGRNDRARAAYSLAVSQLRALGRDSDEAAMLEAKLALD